MHLAEVEHRPAELLSLGVCHNLVFHGVVVAVGLYAHMAHDACCPRLVEHQSHVILRGGLGAQHGIAHVGIVEVVEGGHAETPFHECPQRQHLPAQGVEIGENGGCPAAEQGLAAACACAVLDYREEDACLNLHP